MQVHPSLCLWRRESCRVRCHSLAGHVLRHPVHRYSCSGPSLAREQLTAAGVPPTAVVVLLLTSHPGRRRTPGESGVKAPNLAPGVPDLTEPLLVASGWSPGRKCPWLPRDFLTITPATESLSSARVMLA